MRTRKTLGKLVAVMLVSVLSVGLTTAGNREAETPPCPPIAGIIEGPDPIPSRCLDDFVDASEDSDAAQSPEGDQVVAWADPVGEDHDIALREWTGEGWEATRYLTSELVDEREPNVFLDRDGTLYVAWTRYGDTPQVVFARRDPVSRTWSVDVVVAGNARRPAIVARDGRAVVAFERLVESRKRELVVAVRRIDGGFDMHVVPARIATSPEGALRRIRLFPRERSDRRD